MASSNIVDLGAILAPISESFPTGADARQDMSPNSGYQIIKSARNSARAAERNSILEDGSNDADQHWRTIIDIAPGLLSTQTKDLEIASWFAEAMVRLRGAQGLRDAFLVIHGLVEHFWENLYPMPDEDGMETRVSCISGLNGEGAEGVLIAPIRKIEITEGKTHGPFSLWQYQQALDAQKVPEEKVRMAKIEKLGFSLENIETAVSESREEFYVNLRDDLSECIELYKKLGVLLDQHCGAYNAPPIRTVLEVLGECLGAVSHLGKDKFPVAEVIEEAIQEESNASGETTPKAASKAGINSREAAFKQIQEAARYFKKTEPHSPVSYILEKAIRWGNMPLEELINELIPDTNSRNNYSNLTGVMDPNSKS
jgi:type VI secretion system protein ImpA